MGADEEGGLKSRVRSREDGDEDEEVYIQLDGRLDFEQFNIQHSELQRRLDPLLFLTSATF
jgi:hypothetical protein